MEEIEKNSRVFLVPGISYSSGDEITEPRRLEVSLDDLIMITKGYRPRLMSIEDFKFVGNILKKELKQYLKGKLFHVSKVNDAVWAEYTKGANHIIKQKGNTYVRKGDEGVEVHK